MLRQLLTFFIFFLDQTYIIICGVYILFILCYKIYYINWFFSVNWFTVAWSTISTESCMSSELLSDCYMHMIDTRSIILKFINDKTVFCKFVRSCALRVNPRVHFESYIGITNLYCQKNMLWSNSSSKNYINCVVII